MKITDQLPSFAPAPIARMESIFDSTEQLFDLLPVGVYVCDRDGNVRRYNRKAAEICGASPSSANHQPWFCGVGHLLDAGGNPLSLDDSPPAHALRTHKSVRDRAVLVARPDGTLSRIRMDADPLTDHQGEIAGVICVVRQEAGTDAIGKHAPLDDAAAMLAAVVESSADAILTKDLDGIITSWNAGAGRIFGYSAEEAVGKPVTMLIPDDRQDEEPAILARIRKGERVDPFETVRQRKDGTLLDISLTVSPLKDREGRVIGASKIARDISERKRAEEQQRLLLREMNHRVKNLFTISSSLVTLSARTAKTPQELAADVRARLGALARAHSLTLPGTLENAAPQSTTLHELIGAILAPYEAERSRISISGPDIALSGSAVTSLALLLHELATNAAKYGGLSTPDGQISIRCNEQDGHFLLEWTEQGGPTVKREDDSEGFGSLLGKASVEGHLGGKLVRHWRPEGLSIELSIECERLSG